MAKKHMKISIFQKSKFIIPFLAMTAVVAGMVNGFLGTGGGIILMLVLSLLPADGDNAVRDRFATIIAVILPLSLISAVSYGDKLNFELSAKYIIPGILGGFAGGFLLDKISVKLVKRLFSLMVIWAGINFLIK